MVSLLSFFFLKIFTFYFYECFSLHVYLCNFLCASCPQRPEEDIKWPGTRDTDVCEPPRWCWEMNPWTRVLWKDSQYSSAISPAPIWLVIQWPRIPAHRCCHPLSMSVIKKMPRDLPKSQSDGDIRFLLPRPELVSSWQKQTTTTKKLGLGDRPVSKGLASHAWGPELHLQNTLKTKK